MEAGESVGRMRGESKGGTAQLKYCTYSTLGTRRAAEALASSQPTHVLELRDFMQSTVVPTHYCYLDKIADSIELSQLRV